MSAIFAAKALQIRAKSGWRGFCTPRALHHNFQMRTENGLLLCTGRSGPFSDKPSPGYGLRSSVSGSLLIDAWGTSVTVLANGSSRFS